jgi:hypothetical protein
VNPTDETARRIAVPVKKRDVLPMAKKTCRTCGGMGEFRSVIANQYQVCGCAQRRFMREASVHGRGRWAAVRRAPVRARERGDSSRSTKRTALQADSVSGG